MPTVNRISFNSYAGPRISGTDIFRLKPQAGHWDRVLWLTSTVESGGKFGAITMYDGTAVTAGLHQAIAVYPRELADEDFNAKDDQGSFWQLLRMLEMIPDFPELQDLFAKFKSKGWYLGRDGSLRYLADGKTQVRGRTRNVRAGDEVFGFEIREAFTPNQGAVPASGSAWEASKSWALDFHKIFSNPKSFKAQEEFGAQHFEHVARHKLISARGRSQSIEGWLYRGHLADFKAPSWAYDLALAVFWSHSVNGPSVAYRLLAQALEASDPNANPDDFATTLLRLLGRKKYGRWHWSEPDGRWQRTRTNAKKLWPEELFSNGGVMPSTL
jgi:hypothetical protein